MAILWDSEGSWHVDLGPGLMQFLVGRSCGGLGGSWRGPLLSPCVIFFRSLQADFAAIPLQIRPVSKILRCFALVPVGKVFRHARREFLYEDLVILWRSSLQVVLRRSFDFS